MVAQRKRREEQRKKDRAEKEAKEEDVSEMEVELDEEDLEEEEDEEEEDEEEKEKEVEKKQTQNQNQKKKQRTGQSPKKNAKSASAKPRRPSPTTASKQSDWRGSGRATNQLIELAQRPHVFHVARVHAPGLAEQVDQRLPGLRGPGVGQGGPAAGQVLGGDGRQRDAGAGRCRACRRRCGGRWPTPLTAPCSSTYHCSIVCIGRSAMSASPIIPSGSRRALHTWIVQPFHRLIAPAITTDGHGVARFAKKPSTCRWRSGGVRP